MKDSVSGKQGSLGAEAGHFLPHHLVDFWLNLALCHALLVDTSDGDAQYQVSYLAHQYDYRCSVATFL